MERRSVRVSTSRATVTASARHEEYHTTAPQPGQRRRPEPASFLRNLHKILKNEDPSIIRWHADGKITIGDPVLLSSNVLHKYFRHNQFSSFQRQLNYFGYYKISGKGKLEACVYTNDALPAVGSQPGLTAPPYSIDALLTLRRKSAKEAALAEDVKKKTQASSSSAPSTDETADETARDKSPGSSTTVSSLKKTTKETPSSSAAAAGGERLASSSPKQQQRATQEEPPPPPLPPTKQSPVQMHRPKSAPTLQATNDGHEVFEWAVPIEFGEEFEDDPSEYADLFFAADQDEELRYQTMPRTPRRVRSNPAFFDWQQRANYDRSRSPRRPAEDHGRSLSTGATLNTNQPLLQQRDDVAFSAGAVFSHPPTTTTATQQQRSRGGDDHRRNSWATGRITPATPPPDHLREDVVFPADSRFSEAPTPSKWKPERLQVPLFGIDLDQQPTGNLFSPLVTQRRVGDDACVWGQPQPPPAPPGSY